MPQKIVMICGPTATGKTKLGVALAKALNGEVVSADSMQIYQGMVIGTAAPTPEEMEGVPHHMLAIVPPTENYSVARYVEDAAACVDDILARGKVPIVVGGTGLYLDALRKGRTFSAFVPESGWREKLQARAREEGMNALYADLQKIDPEAANRLHPNDEKRVIRALEVFYETGETISAHNKRTRDLPPRYDAAVIALTYADRSDLYARIDARVDEMMKRGLADEVRALLRAGVDVGEINRHLYQEKPMGTLLMNRETLEEMQLTAGGAISYYTLTAARRKELNVSMEDTKDLVDYIRSLKGVILSIIFEELEDGFIRMSLRSKDRRFNVAQIAKQFGGGGHDMAAGIRMRGELAECREKVLEALRTAVCRVS